MTAAPKPRAPGDTLEGRYRLVARLGRGGFGDVWRAEELLPDGLVLREVALKLLHEQLSADTDWSEEARIIASLRHPALVTIYAAGLLALERPCPFVAMELLLGESLAAPVGRGELVRWRRVLGWARAAAAALDEIHRAGVVHLDLKPANLFVTDSGALKVLDFGISQRGRGRSGPSSRHARGRSDRPPPPPADGGLGELSTAEFVVQQEQAERSGASTATVTRSVVGTPGFMAPEILEDAEATPASDAYALAACIVQLATGQLPQRVAPRPPAGASAAEVRAWYALVQGATLRGQIRDLNDNPTRIPPALARLLERWLALDPLARSVERTGLQGALDEVWRCPYGWGDNPYRGLEPYRSEDEGRLFGREDDIARIARELELQSGVALHGAEGIGLRSLALAGVVPELARSFVDGCDDWAGCPVELDLAPDAALLRAVEAVVGPSGGPAATRADPEPEALEASSPASSPEALEEGGAPDGEARRAAQRLLDAIARHVARGHVGLVVVLLGLDRLLDAEPRERALASALLERAAGSRPPRGLRIIATLREARTAELLAAPVLGRALRPWLRFLGPPPLTAIARIVREPALGAGLRVRGVGVVEQQLQQELSEDGSRLGLVSLALKRWWHAAQGSGELTGEGWHAGGGVVGALGHHADELLASLDEGARSAADGVLLRCVRADGTLCSAMREELERAADDSALAAETIDRLIAARIVVPDGPALRLAHPRLPEAWARLRDLRLRHLDRLVFVEELRLAARRWLDEGRRPDLLWRGHRLQQLARDESTLSADLGADERAFVTASRRAVVRRWAVWSAVALAALLVVALAATVRATLEERALSAQRARQQAERREAIAQIVSRSRRTADPYVRVALLGAAIELGSDDPVLPLELLSTAGSLPSAHFLSLDPVPRPHFPWGGRWLVGGGAGAYVTLVDFTPLQGTPWGPLLHRFRPHEQGMDDLVAFPFDSSFVTRGLDGELRVWRARLSGEVALAARSPMRCVGGLNPVVVAERAPVVACASSDGLSRWDLREPAKVTSDTFQGRVLHLSADGQWLVAARLGHVLLWHAASGRRYELDATSAPAVARFSPRDDLVALVRVDGIDIYDLAADPPEIRLALGSGVADPVAARWSPNGLDLAVCGASDHWQWSYLRRGARAASDAAPPTDRNPCARAAPGEPESLRTVEQYGELLAGQRRLGPREWAGGWKLDDERLLTRDLVLFKPKAHAVQQLLSFVGKDPSGALESPRVGDSAVRVERDGPDQVVWQVGGEIRLYDVTGKRLLDRPGQLLDACPDRRLLAWRKRDEGAWELFGARHNVELAQVRREPAFVLGVDATCSRLFLQRVDGRLAFAELTRDDRSPALEELPVAGGYALDGYVYDVRPSAGGDGPEGPVAPGLWLAMSSGAMARLEGPRGELRPYGHATPRPTAMSDGFVAGELIFADATGVTLRSRGSARDQRLLDAAGDLVWEDLRALRHGRYVMLSTVERVAVLDAERGQILDELLTAPRGRLTSWDDDGSLLLWSSEFDGPARGEIIPVGRPLAAAVAGAVSNLTASLGERQDVRLTAAQ